MAAQWPLIVKQLVLLFPQLPGWSNVVVTQGRNLAPTTPLQYCTVGFTAGTETSAGDYKQVRDPDGFQLVETGNVRSQINVSVPSKFDVAGQQDALFVLCDAFEASIRADRTLGGLLSVISTLEVDVEVLSLVDGTGTAEAAVLTLSYYTVT